MKGNVFYLVTNDNCFGRSRGITPHPPQAVPLLLKEKAFEKETMSPIKEKAFEEETISPIKEKALLALQ